MTYEKEFEKYFKMFVREQGFDVDDELFEILFELADKLNVKGLGELTLFFTFDVMPIIQHHCKQNQVSKKQFMELYG